MKRILAAMIVVGAVFISTLGLPLCVGVWLPDVLSTSARTLAEQHLASGHSFLVVQYWNTVDFYTTELRHTRPNGLVEVHVLDTDDSKSWSLPMVINEESGSASVTLSGGRVKKLDW